MTCGELSRPAAMQRSLGSLASLLEEPPRQNVKHGIASVCVSVCVISNQFSRSRERKHRCVIASAYAFHPAGPGARAPNLGRLVSGGGGKETSIWRDVTGQNGSLMSADVLQLLPALRVPHLLASKAEADYLQFGFTRLMDVVREGRDFHLHGTVEGPGQQPRVIRQGGEKREASDLLPVTLEHFTLARLPLPNLRGTTELTVIQRLTL